MKRTRTMCVYGPTGTYKTTNVGRLARMVYAQTGKTTRLLSADGGGWEACQPEIAVGIIQPLSLLEFNNILPAMRHLSRGEWPGLMGDKPTWLPWKDDNGVGAYAIEGLTSISTLILRDLTNKGRKVAEDVVGQFKEEDELFAAPARAHYGMVQNFMIDQVLAFSALRLEYLIWTSHEGKGEDVMSKTIVYGPGTVGKAATDKMPPLFGDLIHLEPVITKQGDKTERQEVRAYIRSHPDNQNPNVLWPAKVRVQPEAVAEVEKLWPGGYFVLTTEMGIDNFNQVRDTLAAKYTNEANTWKEQVDKQRTTNQQER